MTGNQQILNAAITTTAVAYSAGDSIGGLILQNPGSRINMGRINDVKIVDTLNQKPALTIFLFNAPPSASTITDNAPFDLHANDAAKVVGVIGIAAGDYPTGDYVQVDTQGFADVTTQVDVNWSNPLQGDTTDPLVPTLWMAIVTSGTPTYGANATSLYVKLGLDTVSR